MRLPKGAMQILEARRRKLKPSQEVMLIAKPGLTIDWETQCIVNLKADYDWVFLKNLPAIIVLDSTQPYNKTFAAIADVVGTHFLRYWFEDKQTGGYVTNLPTVESIDKPFHRWEYDLSLTPNIAWEDREWSKFFKEITVCI